MDKTQKIRVISIIICFGFLLSVLLCWYRGSVLGFGYPLNTFLGRADIMFSDYVSLVSLVKDLNPYVVFNRWLNYFLFAYMLLYPFSLIKYPYLSYLVFVCIFIFFYTKLNIKFLHCENLTKFQNFLNIFIICFLSYPFLFLINRGNIDMMFFLIFSVYVICFQREMQSNNKNFSYSVIPLGILCASKPYFLMFLLFYLKKQKYKEFLIGCILPIILTILSLLIFKGSVNAQLNIFLQNLEAVKSDYILSTTEYWGLGFSSSLCGILKAIFVFGLKLLEPHTFSFIYSVISVILFILTVIFMCKEKSLWKQFTIISLYVYSIPFIVYDYKLLFFLVPIWMFVNCKEQSKFDLAYSILFALLLIPKNLVVIPLSDGMNFLSSNMLLNPILMLIFAILIFIEQNKKQLVK